MTEGPQDPKPQDPPVASNAAGNAPGQAAPQGQDPLEKAIEAAQKVPGVKMLDIGVTPVRVSGYIEAMRLHEGAQSADKKTTLANDFKMGPGTDFYFRNSLTAGQAPARFFGGREKDVLEVEHKLKGGRLTGRAEAEIHEGWADINVPVSIPAAAFAPDPSQVPAGAPPVTMVFGESKLPDINGRAKVDIGYLPDHTSLSLADGAVKMGLVGVHGKTEDAMGTLDWHTTQSACVTPVSGLGDAVRLDVCESHGTAGGVIGEPPRHGVNVQFEADSTKIAAGLHNLASKVFHKRQR